MNGAETLVSARLSKGEKPQLKIHTRFFTSRAHVSCHRFSSLQLSTLTHFSRGFLYPAVFNVAAPKHEIPNSESWYQRFQCLYQLYLRIRDHSERAILFIRVRE
jgi:hypothetical protein